MLWYQYRLVLGQQYRQPFADLRGAHLSKELRYGRDGPQRRRPDFSCADLLCAGR